jgi:hypothetical protein
VPEFQTDSPAIMTYAIGLLLEDADFRPTPDQEYHITEHIKTLSLLGHEAGTSSSRVFQFLSVAAREPGRPSQRLTLGVGSNRSDPVV